MTILVGVLCDNAVVIGADSSTTFVAGRVPTVEQPTRKLSVIRDQLLVASSGEVGLGQRLVQVCEQLHEQKNLQCHPIEVGRRISKAAIKDFISTNAHVMGTPRSNHIELGALVAGHYKQIPYLVELAYGTFQPEVKTERIWFVSMGRGQPIADPFLGLLRRSLELNAPPTISTGKFIVAWTLDHVCDTNPGGVKGPYHLGVVERVDGKFAGRELDEYELEEHNQLITEAHAYLREFPNKVFESEDAPAIPE